MINGITFDEQQVKAENMAHLVKTFGNGSNGITRGCNITYDSDNMYISEGYLLIQGRQIQVIGNHTFALEKVTTGEQYCNVVYEIDLSKTNTEDTFNQGTLKTVASSSGYPAVTQQDLEDNPTGVYQYLLAQYHSSTSGIDSFTVKASKIDADWLRESEFASRFNSSFKSSFDSSFKSSFNDSFSSSFETAFAKHFSLSGTTLKIT